MNRIKLIIKKIQRKLSFKRSRLNTSARMFIPGIGKKLIVFPFTTLIIIPVVLLVAISGYLLIRSDVFLVKNVTVTIEGGIEGDSLYSEGIASLEEIQTIAEDKTVARSLWNVDTTAIATSIKEKYPSIENVTVDTKLLESVNVLVQERKAIAQVSIEKKEVTPDGKELSKEEYYLIDQNGEIYLQVNRKVALPVFNYPSEFQNIQEANSIIGYTFPQSLTPAVVKIINSLEEYGRFELNEVIVKDSTTLEITTSEQVKLVIGIMKDIDEQIRKLEVVHEQIVYSGRAVSLIDTRFDKTVVQYK